MSVEQDKAEMAAWLAVLIDYEVRGCWWTGYVPPGPLFNLAAAYFARKALRKLGRCIVGYQGAHHEAGK